MPDADATATADSGRRQPTCPMGATCHLTGLLHFADFAHPEGDYDDVGVQTEATSAADGGQSSSPTMSPPVELKRQDTVPIDEFLAAKRSRRSDEDDGGRSPVDEEQSEKKPITRGLSLMRQFSAMSHAERKALVAEAIAARLSLERRLRRAESRERRLSDRTLFGALPAMPEEREALQSGGRLRISLTPERLYSRPHSPEEVHYRMAESQFHRLLARDCVGCFQVTKVEYLVNPKLLREFRQFQRSLQDTEGLTESDWHPVLAFHGTDDANIDSICFNGFWTPSGANPEFAQASDTGWYGRGIYFSEYPACAMDYVKGRSRLLLCMVLPGRCHHCAHLSHGQPCSPGHHSHRSPDGRELVAFNASQALPAYVVHYQRITAASTDAVDVDTSGPHDDLHSLYFRASGLTTQLLAGRDISVHPDGFGSPGLLLTPDQVARFCLAQGATRILTGFGGDHGAEEAEAESESRCVATVVRLSATGGDDVDGDRVVGFADLLRRALEASEKARVDVGGSNS